MHPHALGQLSCERIGLRYLLASPGNLTELDIDSPSPGEGLNERLASPLPGEGERRVTLTLTNSRPSPSQRCFGFHIYPSIAVPADIAMGALVAERMSITWCKCFALDSSGTRCYLAPHRSPWCGWPGSQHTLAMAAT